MTIRDYLNRRKTRISVIALISWAMFFVGLLSCKKAPILGIIAVVGFIAFLASVLYLIFALRCPNCKSMLGYVTTYCHTMFKISQRFRFCPFCGVNIDNEMNPDGSNNHKEVTGE